LNERGRFFDSPEFCVTCLSLLLSLVTYGFPDHRSVSSVQPSQCSWVLVSDIWTGGRETFRFHCSQATWEFGKFALSKDEVVKVWLGWKTFENGLFPIVLELVLCYFRARYGYLSFKAFHEMHCGCIRQSGIITTFVLTCFPVSPQHESWRPLTLTGGWCCRCYFQKSHTGGRRLASVVYLKK